MSRNVDELQMVCLRGKKPMTLGEWFAFSLGEPIFFVIRPSPAARLTGEVS
jgi:hypothetical protein